MKESILPRMYTRTHDIVLGGLRKSASHDRKMVLLIGEPGDGKTTTVLDFCSSNDVPSSCYRCSPNTSMKSLLTFMANAVGAHIGSSRNDEIQEKVQQKLKEDNNYCFVFDEVENLISGSCAKIDVIRQIYDSTNVQVVLCGTYDFKDLVCGERRKATSLTHNRPQIFRRLRKEEFDRISEKEVYDYLEQLESYYAVSFDNAAKASLVSTCRDRQSGGLGNFIEIIELVFSYVRPEWEEISYQIIHDTGRVLHTNFEESQSFTGIKPAKEEAAVPQAAQPAPDKKNPAPQAPPPDKKAGSTPSPDKTPIRIDISSLPVVTINLPLIKDAMRHKVTM